MYHNMVMSACDVCSRDARTNERTNECCERELFESSTTSQ